jgi:hypothetical protein
MFASDAPRSTSATIRSCGHGDDRSDQKRVVELVPGEDVPERLRGAEQEDGGGPCAEEAEHPDRGRDPERPEERNEDDEEVDHVRANEPTLRGSQVQADAVLQREDGPDEQVDREERRVRARREVHDERDHEERDDRERQDEHRPRRLSLEPFERLRRSHVRSLLGRPPRRSRGAPRSFAMSGAVGRTPHICGGASLRESAHGEGVQRGTSSTSATLIAA